MTAVDTADGLDSTRASAFDSAGSALSPTCHQYASHCIPESVRSMENSMPRS